MPKHIHCAKCGVELLTRKKAIPKEGRIITVVEPHKCDETLIKEFKGFKDGPPDLVEPIKNTKEVDELFDSFPFVQKLNKETSEQETVGFSDKRNKKHLREEIVDSTAPLGILDATGALGIKK